MDPSLENWLQFAPKPRELQAGKQWHVFLSYRSVDRSWVLALHDVLKQLDYSVFLDQYVLSAAVPLALTLGEALDASASAIMIWSHHFEHSEWCKTEYNKLEQMEKNRPEFRYVIANLDATKLPGFAEGKIYIDFSQDRDRPSGSGLLRMLYGLTDDPLPDKAIRLANQQDEEINAAQCMIKAAQAAGDVDTLEQLAQRETSAWISRPTLGCAIVDALLALGEEERALSLCESLQARFPKALRPQQLRGVALAHSGRRKEAQLVLGQLYVAGEIDPETLAMYARTWTDCYEATGEKKFLRRSRDLYRQAFDADPRDYYTGIRAASRSFLLGETAVAEEIAATVGKLVGTKPTPNDYWKTATAAELQLLEGRYGEAAKLYEAAVGMEPMAAGYHASSLGQARLLLDCLKASDPERQLIQDAFLETSAACASSSVVAGDGDR